VSSSVSEPSSTHDARLDQLAKWLHSVLGTATFDLRPASADASFRRYFRVTREDQTWIAMDAPPDKENLGPYVHVAAILADVGVNAPRILARDDAQGFLLNTDLGSRTYLAEIEAQGNAERLYGDAITALVRIQARAQSHSEQLPAYDEALLRREMMLFPDWFCGRHLELSVSSQSNGMAGVYDALVHEALAQPRVFVHRDYHSRNLMVSDGGRFGPNPGILDFQDAVHGPLTYDLVSLLRDCYVAWPAQRVQKWVQDFADQARAAGVASSSSPSELVRWFDLMGVQRHLKAIGIFARLWHRDGKPGYLKDIPRTLNYVDEVSANYSELAPLRSLIREQVKPAMERLSVQSLSSPSA
jgi:aminoglycoside/choline kinase family phosphotransferase